VSGGRTGFDPFFYAVIGLAVLSGVLCLLLAALAS